MDGAGEGIRTPELPLRYASLQQAPTELEKKSRLGEIVNYGFWMQKQGYRATTIHFSVRSLRWIDKRTNLLEPEQVKALLASAQTSESRKRKLVEDLVRFYKFKNIPFDKPRYKKIERVPFIPLESELDSLISAVGKKTSCFLQLAKETGMRSGEIWNLKWTDADMERQCVNVTPEKNSNSRQLKISSRLVAMLNLMPKEWAYIFRNPATNPIDSIEHFRRNYIKARKRLAFKLNNPRLNQITFHTFRHYKGSMEYYRTKDILYVKALLGHKSIQNTMRYVHLVSFQNDDYVCKTAMNTNEAKELIESGFEYVATSQDNIMLFRKRK
jgi:integrase